MRLGLGLGIDKYVNNAYNDLVKLSTWFIDPARPDLQAFPKLEPRTLPNGVSNTDYTQNVSVDVVITREMVGNLNNRANFTQAQVLRSLLIPEPMPFLDAIQGIFHIPNWTEKARAITGDYVPNRYATRSDSAFFTLEFDLPPGTTLEQARDILAGLVIRYQLATPIDTLNTAQVNPLIDRRGVVGKNLFDPMRPDVLDGRFLDSSGGNSGSSDSFLDLKYYEYTNQVALSSSVAGLLRIGWYDENKVFLRRDTATLLSLSPTPPAGTKFYRVSGLLTQKPTFQLELGSTATAFEPYGKSNVLMTNVAWTNLDGYRAETINGKTNVYFNLDGVDTFGALNSASAPNPTGSDDFWQLVVFRPDIITGFLYWGLSRNTDALPQYGILNNGSNGLQYVVNGVVNLALTTNDTNLKYALFGRINGRRFSVINNIETHDSVYTDSIISRPNTQLACRSSSVDGTTKTGFSKGLQGICAMQVAPQGTIDKTKVVTTVAKAMKQIYGLGV
jgi:hypothetical protein